MGDPRVDSDEPRPNEPSGREVRSGGFGIVANDACSAGTRVGDDVGQPLRRPCDYEEDFAAWAESQAVLLRNRLVHQADLDNIAEELEALSRSERRALRSCLTLVISHLLKLVHQPAKASKNWTNTIHRERRNLERLLQDSPSLKARLLTLFIEAYEDGRFEASKETGLDPSVFPASPVFGLDQVRDLDFLLAMDRHGMPIDLPDQD